ncbi:MAG: hypothetical protein VYE77_07315 [Planctomycetota bacterium]|nr:hypothetical protein [Planctomycetota bacterium]
MDRISVDEATRNLRDLLNVVANGKQRFVINNATEDVAAILSTEDLNLLETLDQDANQAKAGSVDEESLQSQLADKVAEAATNTQRFIVTRGEREMAAIVPMKDIQLLVGLDGQIDLAAAKKLLDQQLGR